jgi:hypothetical protein
VTIHILKLCVGIDSIAHLRERQTARLAAQRGAGEEPVLVHRTRQMPRRRDEVLDGGSLYWVIKGVIQVRQRLLDLRPVRGADGVGRCEMVLDRELVATRPRRRRAFQGWRYLDPADAPPDLGVAGSGDEDMPAELKAELVELGLL